MARIKSGFGLAGASLVFAAAAAFAIAQPPQDPKTQPPSQPGQPGQPSTQPKPADPTKQPPSPRTPGLDDKEQAFKQAGMPGEFHQKLRVFAGEWDGQAKCYEPGAPTPKESRTNMHSAMIMGGKFLHLKVNGTMNDEPFDGFGVIGYNNATRQYESSWIDSTSTDVCYMTGNADSQGKIFTFTGDVTDPTTNKTAKARQVWRSVANDKATLEFYMTGADGKETKMGDVTLTKTGEAKEMPDRMTPKPGARPPSNE
jgi:hypothetical protein